MQTIIQDVRRAGEVGNEIIQDFAIDFPKIGPTPDDTLRICGWIFATGAVVDKALIKCQGTVVRAATVNRPRQDVVAHFHTAGQIAPLPNCGFEAFLLPVELPPHFELSLEAQLPTGTSIPLATIRGQHHCEPASKGLQPLMLTSLGRTGTTALMRMLSQHPAIVIERNYPYETNAATYWMHMRRALVLPADEPPMPLFELGEWNRPPLVAPPEDHSRALHAFVRKGYPSLAADFSRGAIETFYRRLAADQAQSHPHFFCEKMLPTSLQYMFFNTYAGARQILLLRDFRDVFCSALAFNAKRGTVAFGRERVGSDLEYVKELAKGARRLADACHFRGTTLQSHIVRYEDLILRPQATLRGILLYLGLQTSEQTASDMLASLHSDELAAHRTSCSPRQSIGRWQRELNDELRAACRAEFDDLLGDLGYALAADGSLVLGQAESMA